VCKYLLKILLSGLLDVHPVMALLGYIIILLLTFQGTTTLFSTVAETFYILTNHAQDCNFCTSSPTLMFFFSDSGQPKKYEIILHVVLICVSLMIDDIDHSLTGHSYIIFREISIQGLCLFLIRLYILLLLVVGILYIFWI
jgi:hypothetical protein